MDESALDSLIDTLSELAEDTPASPVYTGPEVKVVHICYFCFLENSKIMSVVTHFYINPVFVALTCWEARQSLYGWVPVLFSIMQTCY